MKLLEYLKPMENLPNRFSNLAFWRILRIFKDKVVDAFTYVDTWGTGIEVEQSTQNGILTTHDQMLSSHETTISNINAEQNSQNSAIATNAVNIGTLNSDIDVLRQYVLTPGTYRSITHFESSPTVKEIAPSLYAIYAGVPSYVIPDIPFNITCRASLNIYTDSAKTKHTRVLIPLAYVTEYDASSRKVVIGYNTTPFYAPYGIESLVGYYVSYLVKT